MRAVAFSVVDPHGKLRAQLLDVDMQIKLYLPGLVQLYGLPRELNYVLVLKGAGYPLDNSRTLAQMRIPAGAEIYLRPLRDQILKMVMDKFYDEVKGYIKDQLMDLAKERLRQILDLDPAYPDPLHLKEMLFGGVPQSPQPQSLVQQPAPQKFMQQAPSQYKVAQPVKPKPVIGLGWIIGGIVGGGALLVVAGIVAISVIGALISTTNTGYSPGDVGPNSGVVTESGGSGPVLGTGDVQITLRWNAPVDLDLHVIDPNQEEIYFNHRTSSSGGQLDVDANPGCNPMMENPVENVYWPYGGAPGGTYVVNVAYFSDCGSQTGPVNFEITIRQNGQVYDVITGSINDVGGSQQVGSFTR